MAVIGTAYVNIRALTDKLQSDIERGLSPAVKQAGDRAGRDLGDSISRQLRNTKIDLPRVDTSSIERDISSVRAKVDVDVDANNAASQLESAMAGAGGRAGQRAGEDFISRFGAGNISNYLKRIFYQILWGTPVVGALVGALSSLASGFISLASAIGPAVNALAVVPGIMGSAIGSIGTLGIAFSGVGKAFSAGQQQIASAGGGASKAVQTAAVAAERAANRVSDSQERAAERIAEANQRAAEQIEATNRRIVEARERLSDLYEDTSRRIEQAQKRIADSQRDELEANEGVLKAQNAVNEAREKAVDSIKELQFSVEQGAISEGKAAIALERAREKLAMVNELPPNHRLRREAELNYKQAQLDLDEAKKTNQDLAKEQDAAAKNGVEGSAEVLKAKEDLNDAEQRRVDAINTTIEAEKDLHRVQADGAKDIKRAQRDILDLQGELVDIEKERKAAIADANRDVSKSLRDVALSAGAAGGKTGAAGGINAFQQAMANLSPEAQQFVRYLLSIQDELDAVRRAAGQELFPKLITAIDTLITGGMLDLVSRGLREMGGAIGDVAINIATLTTDPFFQGKFGENIDSTVTVTESFGQALVNVIDFTNTLVAAAAPLTEEFAAWIATVTGNWASDARSNFDGLRESILGGGEVVKQLGRIFGNLWGSIKLIGEAARPAGQVLLDAFEGATEKLEAFLATPGQQDTMKQYFSDVAENVKSIGGLFNALVVEFVKLGDNAVIGTMADSLAGLAPIIGETLESVTNAVGPSLVDALDSVLQVFQSLAESGGLQAFIDVIQTAADGVLALTEIPGFDTFIKAFATFYGTYKAMSVVTEISQIPKLAQNLGALNARLAIPGASSFTKAVQSIKASAETGSKASTTLGAASQVLGIRFSGAVGGVRKFGGAMKSSIGGMGKLAKGSGILALVGVLGTLVAAFAQTETGQKVIQKLGEVFSEVFGTIMEVLQPVFDALQPALDALIEAFKPLLDILGTALLDIIETLAPPLKELLAVLGDAFLQVIQALMPLLDAVAQIFLALLPAIVPLVPVVVTLASAFIPLLELAAQLVATVLPPLASLLVMLVRPVATLATNLASFLVPAIETLSAGVEIAANWLTDFINNITGFVTGIADMITAAGGFEGLWDSIVTAASNMITNLVGFFAEMPAKLAEAAGNLFGFLVTKAKAAIGQFKKNGGGVKGWLFNLALTVLTLKEEIKAKAAGLFNIFTTKVKEAIGSFKKNGGGVKGWFYNLALTVLNLKEEIKSKAAGLFNVFTEKVKAAIGSFRKDGGGVKGWFFNLAYTVYSLKEKIANNAKGLFNSFTSNIKSAIGRYASGGGGVKGWFWSIVNFIKKELPGKISAAAKNIWGGLSGGAVDVVGKVMQWVGRIPGINGTLKLGGKSFKYAKGGFYEDHVAQIARAGANRIWAEPETGGEAYIPLAPQKRQRSERILEVVAQKFGYGLEKRRGASGSKFANGGLWNNQTSGTAKFANGGLWSSEEIKLPKWLGWIPGLKNLKVNSLFNAVIDKVASFFRRDNKGEEGVDSGRAGNGMVGGIRAMTAAVQALDPSARITSSLRPGAITATGYPSYHGLGRAIDIVSSNMGKTWELLKKSYGRNAPELFYTPKGFMRYGKMGDAADVTKRTHYSHVHWAMAKGGTVSPSAGGTNVTVAEAGKPETITPLRSDGLTEGDFQILQALKSQKHANININIYGQQGQDINALAQEVERVLAWHMR